MRDKIILILAVLTILAASAYKTYIIVEQDYKLYKLESACAMKQVSKGIARRDVKGCGKADYK